jgi:hypothetical protein
LEFTLFVTVYFPFIIAADIALLQVGSAAFVVHCNLKPRAFVGHVKTMFVPIFTPVSNGPTVVKPVATELLLHPLRLSR